MPRHTISTCALYIGLALAAIGCGDSTENPGDSSSGPNEDTHIADSAPDSGEVSVDTVTSDDVKAPDDSAAPKEDVAEEDTSGGDTSDLPCICPKPQHCTDNNQCADDVCSEGTTTCGDPKNLKICNDDGSAFELVPCEDEHACALGECVPTICEPGAPPTCEDGALKSCNSLGTDYQLVPCPGGKACVDGSCVPIEPNVILVLDTSGSMNWLNEEGTNPQECEGAECPPWEWPQACDNPDQPATRLGKAKKALQSVVGSEAAQSVRLALQRFPQNMNLLLGAKGATCSDGGMMGLTSWTAAEHQTHEIPADKMLGNGLSLIMPVPFSADGSPTKESILSWIDFSEEFDSSEKTCNLLPLGCPGETGEVKACIDGFCAIQTQPELRGVGETPIGRSLFYAGEFLRHRVVVQGQTCQADADCGSPHYTCQDGACHDPFRNCRPNVIVLFTDGGESVDTWAEIKESSSAFFNPRVQAKRLQSGLGCASDDDCLNGATCVDSICTVSDNTVPQKACHLTDVPCDTNLDCKPYKYKCGPAQTCSGECEETGLLFTDTKAGKEVLRDAAGAPISATIHVVDASNHVTPNSIIAALGGGNHVPVDFDDVESLIDAFLPLLDIKTAVGGCE